MKKIGRKSKKLFGHIPIWMMAILVAGVLVMGTLTYLLLNENQFFWAGDVEITSDAVQEYITFEEEIITTEIGEFTYDVMDFPTGAGLTNGDDITITKTFESFTGDTFTIEFDLSNMPIDGIWEGVVISIFEEGTTTPLSVLTLEPCATATFDINYFVNPLFLQPDPLIPYPFDLICYINRILANPYAGWLLNDNGVDFYSTYNLGDAETPVYTTGKINQGLSGSGGYLEDVSGTCFDDIDYDAPFTLAFWVSYDSIPSGHEHMLLSKYASSVGVRVLMSGSNLLILRLQDGTNNIDVRCPITGGNTWQHCVITYASINYDGTDITFFIDGSEVTKTIVSNDVIGSWDNAENFKLGSGMVAGEILDIVYIDNSVIGQSLIDILYNSGSGTETLP